MNRPQNIDEIIDFIQYIVNDKKTVSVYDKGVLRGYADFLYHILKKINYEQHLYIINKSSYMLLNIRKQEPFVLHDFFLAAEYKNHDFVGLLPHWVYEFRNKELKTLSEYIYSSDSKNSKILLGKALKELLSLENKIDQRLYEYLNDCLKNKLSIDSFKIYKYKIN